MNMQKSGQELPTKYGKKLIIKSLLMRIIRNKFANFQKSAMIVSRKKT